MKGCAFTVISPDYFNVHKFLPFIFLTDVASQTGLDSFLLFLNAGNNLSKTVSRYRVAFPEYHGLVAALSSCLKHAATSALTQCYFQTRLVMLTRMFGRAAGIKLSTVRLPRRWMGSCMFDPNLQPLLKNGGCKQRRVLVESRVHWTAWQRSRFAFKFSCSGPLCELGLLKKHLSLTISSPFVVCDLQCASCVIIQWVCSIGEGCILFIPNAHTS